MKVGNAEIIVTRKSVAKNAKYVYFDTGIKTEENIIRASASRVLSLAQKNKVKSLFFSSSRHAVKQFPYMAASKIIAQEVFRYLRTTKKPALKKIFFVIPPSNIFAVFKKNVEGYLKYMLHKLSQGPYLTVDGIIEYKGGIVMIERSNPPLGWAIPGGFVDYGESVEDAVKREVEEETSLKFKNFKLFRVCSEPTRDPRFHTVSVVFVGKGQGRLKSASDAKDAKVFKLDSLPSKIAFDHRQVIGEYIRKFRPEAKDQKLRENKTSD
jgi:ADP-ribose pyrophosphatase YjhB (NUDIX family)